MQSLEVDAHTVGTCVCTPGRVHAPELVGWSRGGSACCSPARAPVGRAHLPDVRCLPPGACDLGTASR